jgi:salicylate hydroxylase
MKKKIAIIGSGIAGLTLANFLYKNKNHDFMVYEKNESLPLEEGYGVQLSTNSIKILNEINFAKINSEKIYHPKGVDIYNIQNKKICDLDLMQFNANDNKYTTLQRSTLIEFLKDDIYNRHIRFGKRIKEVSELKGKVLIKFDDNTNDLVDYVIGADGVFSNTRTFFEKKKNKPLFKNAIAIRTILKSTPGLKIDQSKVSLMMGKNCHLVIYPINKKKELNFVCILRHKKKDPDNTKILLDKVVKQNPNLEKVFEEDLKSWPLYVTPKILTSTNSKVFYIGDAFNSFLPTLAQGAGQSIESAYELFNLIKNERENIQDIYFQERSMRAKIVRRRSNLNFFIFHLSSKFMQIIRNFLMKFLIKRRGFINSYLGSIYKN